MHQLLFELIFSTMIEKLLYPPYLPEGILTVKSYDSAKKCVGNWTMLRIKKYCRYHEISISYKPVDNNQSRHSMHVEHSQSGFRYFFVRRLRPCTFEYPAQVYNILWSSRPYVDLA